MTRDVEEHWRRISAAMLETNDVAELSDLQKSWMTDSQGALMEGGAYQNKWKVRDDSFMF